MIRIEIVGNRSIQDDLFDELQRAGLVEHYTLAPVVHGAGSSGPRHGDHVWPEENFALTIVCDGPQAERIKQVVRALKQQFTQEGIKLFASEVTEVV